MLMRVNLTLTIDCLSAIYLIALKAAVSAAGGSCR